METNRFSPPGVPVDDVDDPAAYTPLAPGNLLQVEFELKFRDLLLFNVVHQLMSPLVQAVMLLFAAAAFARAHDGHGLAVPLMTAASFYGFGWVVQIGFVVLALALGRNRTLLTHHVVGVNVDALRTRSRYVESTYYWPAVVKLARRPGFVAIYMTRNGAQVIPNRAFRTEQRRREFLELVKAGIREAA